MSGEALLAGVTVLSIAEQFPGPYATLLLADLGADVVVVERPGIGDPTRHSSPDFHESLNRNKRSVALDLKAAAGREAFLRLAAEADVVFEGFRPGVVARLGVDYESICAVNSDVVYVSISGFGQDGPLRDRPAHDLSLQAISGALHDRLALDDPGSAPWIAIGDLSAGTFAAVAALGGLVNRGLTGAGSYIDVSMADGLMSWMTPFLFAAANDAPLPVLPPREPGYGLFRTADDGAISLSIAFEDWFWAPLCSLLGIDGYAAMPAEARSQRFDELRQVLAATFVTRSRAEWEQLLGESGVPFTPVLSLSDVLGHPHVADRHIVHEVPPNGRGPARRHVRQPLSVRGAPTEIRRHVPTVGEHTGEVLLAAGFTEGEIADLVASGVAAG